ncbi:MAG: proprotein convertase P-domain-containing protein [Polyangiaceae bacterium]|nr:proprotein convertase P-domain-containing protein [Polyangiaceae bacterium]
MRTAVCIIAALLCSDVAWADSLRATREQSLREVSHAVQIRISEGIATCVVHRQFENSGSVADEAGLDIDLPAGAAATGLRIRARDRWFAAELMEREKAAALYEELTGFAPYAPKDPALLQWQWADKLHLQVFPVMPGQVSTVEYTLTVPTTYAHGRYWLSYPRVNEDSAEHGSSKPLATPTIVVRPGWGYARTPVTVDGRRAAPETPVVLAAPGHEDWQDLVKADPSASYVASAIVVPESSHTRRSIDTLRLALDINHTYQGDLVVELVTPRGERVAIHQRGGGTKNDLKGKYTVKVPPGTPGAGRWRLVVSDHAALDVGTLNGWTLAFGSGADATTVDAADTPVFIPDARESAADAGVAPISVAPPPIDVMTARLGRAVASGAHAFARLEVDVAPELSKLPTRAQVVFVVDASYSIGAKKLAAELATLRAYATHVPDAQFEIIAYRRRAARVFNTFVPAAELDEKLRQAAASRALDLGNGSALEAGAALVARVLKARPGPRRVVLLTDDLLRSSLSPDEVLSSLKPIPTDTVVHGIVPELDDRYSLERDDEHALAELATHHHGIFATLRGFAGSTPKELVPVVLELVRPIRVDRLSAGGFSLETTSLREGDGLRAWLAADTAPSHVVLTGQLWSDPVRRKVAATSEFSRATAAWVFGSDQHQDLSPDEMMKLALFGRAVSPVTSYVAFEPGTRPSSVGFGTGRGSLALSSFGSGAGRLGAGSVRQPPDLARLIDGRACVAAHKPPSGWHVTLAIETTYDEIVDISTQSTGAFAECLVETAWQVRLDSRFDLRRESFVVELG